MDDDLRQIGRRNLQILCESAGRIGGKFLVERLSSQQRFTIFASRSWRLSVDPASAIFSSLIPDP
jgi:hypothetical protein